MSLTRANKKIKGQIYSCKFLNSINYKKQKSFENFKKCISVNVPMSKIMFKIMHSSIKVDVCTYATSTNCRTLTQPKVGILARKNKLLMIWYSFLGHEYSFFNIITCYLIALKTLKPLKPHQEFLPETKLQLQSLCNHLFTYKTQSSSPKRTLVKLLG